MAGRRILDRWLGPLAIAASCCGLFGCGHEPTSIILEYDVDQDAMPGEIAVETDRLVAAINGRLGKAGRARVSANDHIEVDVFGKVEQHELYSIKRRIVTLGMLEFRIMANLKDHAEEIALAKENTAKSLERDGRAAAHWVALDPKKLPEGTVRDHLITRPDGRGGTEVLVMIDPYNVTGKYLTWVGLGIDPSGRPAINFTFDSQGTVRFGRLTTENQLDHETGIPRYLGIVLDGKLLSAPALRGAVTKNGQITGKFTRDEVETLIAILNAGSLPYRIRLVSERRVAR